MKVTIMTMALLCFLFGFGYAQVYKWTDEKGNIYFVDDFSKVPEKYKKSVEERHKPILGSTKPEIIEMFKGWRRNFRFENNVRSNGIKFENEDLIAVIFFDSRGIAEGVAFLSIDVRDPTCRTSYVCRNRDQLINWATGGKRVNVTYDKSSSRYPCEVYIGNIPD